MLISDSHRVLFIHVQKTGGHTVDGMLSSALPDGRVIDGLTRHPTLATVLEAEPGLADYWTFGFVRNPWARMVSWWSMVQNFKVHAAEGREPGTSMLRKNRFMAAVASYPDFATYVDRGPQEQPRLRQAQLDYLVAGSRRADFIGRTETLSADLGRVYDHLGLPRPDEVPQTNRSRPGDYHDYYDDASRARVAAIFAKDIEAFGYTF